MLPEAGSYEELRATFRWRIPAEYNIGVDACHRWAAAEPARLALVHRGPDGVDEWSFRDISQAANRLSNVLAGHGVARGDRVAILLPQRPETAIAHVAIFSMGAVGVPLFALFGPDALQFRLADSGASVLVTDAAGAEKVADLRDGLPELRLILSVDGPGEGGVLDWAEELARASARFVPLRTGPDDPAFISYTSGTTGSPKGALHAHRSLLGHLPGVEMPQDGFPRAGDRFWTPADWAWIGGLMDALLPAWHHGVAVVAHRPTGRFDPEDAFTLMAELGVRNMFLPPTALKLMRQVPRARERFRHDVRSIGSGGEPLGAELLGWGRETFGLTINEFYGQTECNLVASNRATMMEVRPGSMGRAVPGHDVAILDDDGRPVTAGELGQVAVRSPDPVMFLGYWNQPEATRHKFAGEWLLTGDTGRLDADGYAWFAGRDDDVITSAGYRIGPSEIEDCLLTHPAVAMAAVIGVPDAERTERIKAFVVLRDGSATGDATLADAVRDHVRRRLAAHAYPREVEFVTELPMTTTGKIMRRVLRDRERERGIAVATPTPTEEAPA